MKYSKYIIRIHNIISLFVFLLVVAISFIYKEPKILLLNIVVFVLWSIILIILIDYIPDIIDPKKHLYKKYPYKRKNGEILIKLKFGWVKTGYTMDLDSFVDKKIKLNTDNTRILEV